MKKILMILLCGIMIFFMTGCGNNNVDESSNNEEQQSKTNNNVDESVNKEEQESKTNKEYEEEMSVTSAAIDTMERYDSEVFYLKDRKVTYKTLDSFKSDKKEASHIGITEYFLYDGVHLYIQIKPSSLYDEFFHIQEGKEGKNDPAEGYIGQAKMFNSMESSSFSDDSTKYIEEKKVKIDEREVFYYIYESNTLGKDGSETKTIRAAFNLDEEYVIGIEIWSLKSNKNIDLVSLDNVKKIVKSVVEEKY